MKAGFDTFLTTTSSLPARARACTHRHNKPVCSPLFFRLTPAIRIQSFLNPMGLEMDMEMGERHSRVRACSQGSMTPNPKCPLVQIHFRHNASLIVAGTLFCFPFPSWAMPRPAPAPMFEFQPAPRVKFDLEGDDETIGAEVEV